VLPAALLLVFCLLLLVAWAFAPPSVPWANSLTRLRPGLSRDAEWAAPEHVARSVRGDYLATLECHGRLARRWGVLARELEQHTAGPYLKRQRAALELLVTARGPRLAESLAAEHHIAVRRFSADGLRCSLVDRQTARVLTTRAYWSGRLIHRQRLPEVVLVWEMVYDVRLRRWRIGRLVQTLPAHVPANVAITLAAELPVPAGRDS
jgi:hypothetical protein